MIHNVVIGYDIIAANRGNACSRRICDDVLGESQIVVRDTGKPVKRRSFAVEGEADELNIVCALRPRPRGIELNHRKVPASQPAFPDHEDVAITIALKSDPGGRSAAVANVDGARKLIPAAQQADDGARCGRLRRSKE